jgi:hypothetical protein
LGLAGGTQATTLIFDPLLTVGGDDEPPVGGQGALVRDEDLAFDDVRCGLLPRLPVVDRSSEFSGNQRASNLRSRKLSV